MDQALEEAGIDRKEVYVTNAVKHFKWEPRGKRHRDGKRFVMRGDEKLTVFLELEAAIRGH
jgi:uracil-DNA glycosylase